MKTTLNATTLLNRHPEHRADEDFISEQLNAPDSRFLVLADAKPVINSNKDRTEASLRWFTLAEIEELRIPTADAIFLGTGNKDSGAHFAIGITDHISKTTPLGKEKLNPHVDLRSLAAQGVMSADELSLASQAASIVNWHEDTRCCGRCGSAMSTRDGGWRRLCWSCKFETFPRLDPVVMMLITDGERVVLETEAHFPDKMFSALAGFMEPGDDMEIAIRREVREEIGVDVESIKFVGTQPWPFRHSLMLGCIATTKQADLHVNKHELEDARWFSREELQAIVDGKHPEGIWVPGNQSIVHTLITKFLEEGA